MGNTLTIGGPNSNTNNYFSNSILSKRVKEILTDSTEKMLANTAQSSDNIKVNDEFDAPINKYRACCMGVYNKGDSDNNNFISVKFPYALEPTESDCQNENKCIANEPIAMMVGGEKGFCENTPIGNLEFQDVNINESGQSGKNNSCNAFMVNNCAKSLYDQNCITCTKNNPDDKYCTPKWNSSNVNCFSGNDSQLSFGPEECACVNSLFGYTLNTNPGTLSDLKYKSENENPYTKNDFDESKIDKNNIYTKYSLDLFNNNYSIQYPQVFDKNCATQMSSHRSGISAPYKLFNYEEQPNICLNQINIGNSTIGRAQMQNIQQNNNCGPGSSGYNKNGNQINDTPINSTAKKLAKEKAALEKASKELSDIKPEKTPEIQQETPEIQQETPVLKSEPASESQQETPVLKSEQAPESQQETPVLKSEQAPESQQTMPNNSSNEKVKSRNNVVKPNISGNILLVVGVIIIILMIILIISRRK